MRCCPFVAIVMNVVVCQVLAMRPQEDSENQGAVVEQNGFSKQEKLLGDSLLDLVQVRKAPADDALKLEEACNKGSRNILFSVKEFFVGKDKPKELKELRECIRELERYVAKTRRRKKHSGQAAELIAKAEESYAKNYKRACDKVQRLGGSDELDCEDLGRRFRSQAIAKLQKEEAKLPGNEEDEEEPEEEEEEQSKTKGDKDEVQAKAQNDKDEEQAKAQGDKDEEQAKAHGDKDEVQAKAQGDKDEEQAKAQGDKDEEQAKAQGDKDEVQAKAQGDKDEEQAKAQGDKDEEQDKELQTDNAVENETVQKVEREREEAVAPHLAEVVENAPANASPEEKKKEIEAIDKKAAVAEKEIPKPPQGASDKVEELVSINPNIGIGLGLAGVLACCACAAGILNSGSGEDDDDDSDDDEDDEDDEGDDPDDDDEEDDARKQTTTSAVAPPSTALGQDTAQGQDQVKQDGPRKSSPPDASLSTTPET
eukprot:TRINITY_DN5798_c0_g1_i4.p1 TRINITY_DN5798_c0_g1~~TRINITY_DN5798_c0_g1_i4.p1  ORF type:complete len:482 (-),score=162.84 TRINITY_DN5798_c0_g1_i4:197-1642(-)